MLRSRRHKTKCCCHYGKGHHADSAGSGKDKASRLLKQLENTSWTMRSDGEGGMRQAAQAGSEARCCSQDDSLGNVSDGIERAPPVCAQWAPAEPRCPGAGACCRWLRVTERRSAFHPYLRAAYGSRDWHPACGQEMPSRHSLSAGWDGISVLRALRAHGLQEFRLSAEQ